LSKPWYEPGKYYVSQHNYAKEITKGFHFPKKISFVDSTLRKIYGTVGLAGKVTPDDSIDIANEMEAIGVAEIFINNPQYSQYVFDCCKAIGKQDYKLVFNIEVALLEDTWKEGVDRAAESNADFVELETWTTEREMKLFGFDEEKTIERMHEALEYGKERGLSVLAGFVDIPRANFDFVKRLANESIKSGAEKLTLYDTFGCLSPDGWRFFTGEIRQNLIKDVPVIVHVHNMFGLASAATVAAVTAGAWPDGTMNGVGMECGLGCLEEIALALELMYGVSTGIKLDRLAEYSGLVKEKTGIPVHPNKAILGDQAFLHEYETWIVWYLENPSLANPYIPELVGQKRRLVWGANTLGGFTSGRAGTKAELNKLGLKYTEGDVDKIISIIKKRLETMTTYPVWLTESEVAQICREVCAHKR
jgi:methanogen homocitrate synthase